MASTADKIPGKLLAKGGIRTVANRVDKPVLYLFPGSFNAGKAYFALQLSQKAKDAEIKYICHFRDNYTPEYARINPDTMAVPSMEIDDKVITDSMDLCQYLFEHYPGSGDKEVVAAGRKAEMWAFIQFAAEWDEYMFTYAEVAGSAGDMLNEIRLINLRIYLDQVLTENPADKDTLVDAYVNKIAGINNMKRAQAAGTQKEKDLEENKALLHRVLARGNDLVGPESTGFLFGSNLCTADAFFLPIFRILPMVPKFMEEAFRQYPNLESYWERALDTPEVQEGLMRHVSKKFMAGTVITSMVPKTILAYKMGLLTAPKIPEEIEKRIADITEAKWQAVRA